MVVSCVGDEVVVCGVEAVGDVEIGDCVGEMVGDVETGDCVGELCSEDGRTWRCTLTTSAG